MKSKNVLKSVQKVSGAHISIGTKFRRFFLLLTARAIRLEGLEGTPSPDVSLAYAAGELLSVRRFVVLGTQRPGVRAAHIGPLRWPRHSPAPRAPGLCFYSFMEYCFSLKLSDSRFLQLGF